MVDLFPPPALRMPAQIPPQHKLLWSLDDLSLMCGLSLPTLRKLVKEGLPCIRIGTRCLFRPEAAATWFETRETAEVVAEADLAPDDEGGLE